MMKEQIDTKRLRGTDVTTQSTKIPNNSFSSLKRSFTSENWAQKWIKSKLKKRSKNKPIGTIQVKVHPRGEKLSLTFRFNFNSMKHICVHDITLCTSFMPWYRIMDLICGSKYNFIAALRKNSFLFGQI